jgi:two-component system, OmpR family, sensor kinase
MAVTNPSSPTPVSPLKRLLYSVRLRLALWFVAILAIVLCVFSLFIYARQIRVLRAEAGNRLVSNAARLEAFTLGMLEQVQEREPGGQSPSPLGLPLLDEHDSIAVMRPDGALLLQQGRLTSQNLSAILQEWNRQGQPAEPLPVELDGPPGANLALVTPMRSEHGQAVWLVLAGPVDSGRQLSRLAYTLAASSTLILLLALAGGFWLADRVMRPVQEITHTARQISESDLRRRLHLNRPDELGELADTFDQMLDRIQAAFERQRRFTADASHELRTPLAIIELEVSRTLERRRSFQEYEQALRLVRSENEWMGGLVNELLTLARLDAGQTARQRQPLDLSELVVDVIERLSPLARQKGVALHAGQLDEAPVLGERAYLSQMLINLVENAIKYVQAEAGPCVRLETRKEARQGLPGGRVDIIDNGPGIPAEHLPHLFERFYRVDPARTREAAAPPDSAALGSGLGLAIVQAIVQAHGGRIEVTSQAGQGSVFAVWIPNR